MQPGRERRDQHAHDADQLSNPPADVEHALPCRASLLSVDTLSALRHELLDRKIAEHHGPSSRPPATACWWFLTDRGLDFLVVGEAMPDNCVSVPAIAVAGSTRRRSLLEVSEQTIHEDALPLGETGHSWPEARSSGSIGPRGCQGPLDVGSGSGQAVRSGCVLRSFLRCVCAASEEVRGAIGLALGHGVAPINWAEPNGSSKCRYRSSGLHMVIAPCAREASVQISPLLATRRLPSEQRTLSSSHLG